MKQADNSTRFKLALGLWLSMALLLLVLYFAGVPATYRYLLANPSSEIAADPARLQSLIGELGLSPGLLAGFELVQRVVGGLPFAIIGLFLFWRKVWPQRHEPVRPWGLWALSFVLMWMGFGGGSVAGGAAFIPFSTPLLIHLVRFLVWPTIMAPVLLLYTFPDGRFFPSWTRWATLLFVPLALLLTYIPDALDSVQWPTLPFLVTFILAPLARYRRAGSFQRLQLKWALFGLAATPAAWLLGYVVLAALPDLFQPTPAGLRNELLYKLVVLPLYMMAPICIGVAVLRSRLWDIDVIIRRTLVYSLLTGLLGLVYLGSVVLLQAILGRAAGAQSPLVIVLSTLLIAALFAPLRRRVQELIDRRFFRRKYDAQQVLARFAQTARDEVQLDELTAELVRVVEETMRPVQVTLWLKPMDGR